MKKSVLIAFSILPILVILLLFVQAALTTSQLHDQAKTNATNFVITTMQYCSPPPNSGSGATLEDRVYTALATGLCGDYVANAQQQDSGCFPSDYGGTCDVQRTAQAVLALYLTEKSAANKSEYSTQIDAATKWLAQKNRTSSDIQWYVQLDSNSPITCAVNDSLGKILNVAMGSDKKLTKAATSTSTCLGISPNGYWIQPGSCQVKGVRCFGGGFTITLLYTKAGSNNGVYYVENTTQSFTENTPVVSLDKAMPSYCITRDDNNNICDYENTLWAAAALAKASSYSTSVYSPYLSVSQNDDPVDNALLYNLVGGSSLISQIVGSPNFNIVYPSTAFGSESTSEGYWTSNNYDDKYLSTGLIHWLLGSNLGSTKTSVENWFYDEQESKGS